MYRLTGLLFLANLCSSLMFAPYVSWALQTQKWKPKGFKCLRWHKKAALFWKRSYRDLCGSAFKQWSSPEQSRRWLRWIQRLKETRSPRPPKTSPPSRAWRRCAGGTALTLAAGSAFPPQQLACSKPTRRYQGGCCSRKDEDRASCEPSPLAVS